MAKYQRSVMVRLFVVFAILLVMLLAACSDDDENDESDQYTIGIINLTVALDPIIDGFKEQMTEFGYVEGENLTYVYDGPPASIEELAGLAQKLVDADVDLILSVSTPATQAAQHATAENHIPCVFVPVQDPIASGIVPSLSEPGGNITGVTFGRAEGKRLEWLVQAAPGIERIYVPYNPDDPSPVDALESMTEVADVLGVELVLQSARNAEEVTAAIENIPDDVDAIINLPDSVLGQFTSELTAAAIAHKLPLSVPLSDGVVDGALVSYSMESASAGKQAARLAEQILKGTDPSVLPVEVAEFYLAINLQTAAAIGLDVPENVLRQAQIVIRIGDETE